MESLGFIALSVSCAIFMITGITSEDMGNKINNFCFAIINALTIIILILLKIYKL